MTTTVPFVPSGIDHIVIWIKDLAAAKHWYQTILGCRAGYDYPEIAMTHVWFGSVLVGLWDADDARAAYAAPTTNSGENVHHIAFAWHGCNEDAVLDHLQAHGIAVTRKMRQVGSRGFGLALYFRDPWGNLIELKGPPTYQDPEPVT